MMRNHSPQPLDVVGSRRVDAAVYWIRSRARATVACLTIAFGAVASEPSTGSPLSFERLGLGDGLSQSTVMDLHQDRFGFFWLATENGLNRYDGHEIRSYFRQPGLPEGLPSDYIWAVEEDQAGNLWLGTDDTGVVFWNREKRSFHQIPLTGARGEDLSNVRVLGITAFWL